jgi:hypothetical protein
MAMDKIQRDVMFAGLTDREIAEAVVVEMRRRNLLGCIYAFPSTGGAGVFASSSPADTLRGLNAAQQLQVFSEAAETAIGERISFVPDDTDTSFDPKGWVN